MGRKVQEKKKESTSDNFYKYTPQTETVVRGSPKFSFPMGRRSMENVGGEGMNHNFHQSLELKRSGYSYSMGTAKRFAPSKKETGPYKDSQGMSSTIGYMPNYLKKKN